MQVLEGLIMSYFGFYIYKAIRKVLFLPILTERSYKGLIFAFDETSITENCLTATSHDKNSSI